MSRQPGPILCGRVLDAYGQPVADADVVVWTGLASFFKSYETTTNASGGYAISPVSGARIFHEDEGIYYYQFRISISHAGYKESHSDLVKVPNIDRYRCVKDPAQFFAAGSLTHMVNR